MEIQRPIAVHGEIGVNSTMLFELGMMYAAGHSRPLNLVSAHVCFNLASRQGHDRAPRLRQEIAAEMSADEMAAAQRAARDCLSVSISEVLAAVENAPASHGSSPNHRHAAALN
jgi:TPR repeat protein